MVIGYARVSTKLQSLDLQVKQLKEFNCEKVYREKITGTHKERAELKKCLAELKSGDTLVVTKLDRLARNLSEGIEIIDDLFKRNIKVHVINIGVLENTTMGRFFMQCMLSFAEVERNMIVERINEGIENAKNNPNIMLGRPKKYTQMQLDHAVELLNSNSYKNVSRMTGISLSTLQRAKQKHDEKEYTKSTNE